MLTELEYTRLFLNCVVDKNKYPVIDKVIDQMTPNKKVYDFIARIMKQGETYLHTYQTLVLNDAGMMQALYYNGMPMPFRQNIFSAPVTSTSTPFAPSFGIGNKEMPLADFNAAAPTSQFFPSSAITTYAPADDVLKQLVRVPKAVKNGSSGAEIPWYVIGLIHYIECGFSFKKHLFNGDSLSHKTVKYPPGRPLTNDVGPEPYNFVESALDALSCLKFGTQTSWRLPLLLYNLEKYNGLGYQKHNPPIHSPYLWSYSNQYAKGKFVEKKVKGHFKTAFDSDLVSKQVGLAVILKRMEDRNLIAIPRL